MTSHNTTNDNELFKPKLKQEHNPSEDIISGLHQGNKSLGKLYLFHKKCLLRPNKKKIFSKSQAYAKYSQAFSPKN
uniref:Uncharacterized protein n=1 Tax=Megaselia scalaris TaxID=36166 RepID=T1GMY2_MEGSC